MTRDVFAIVWTMVPLAVYLIVIGLLQVRRRCTVLSGFADTLLLGVGLAGFVTLGPLELILPESATSRLGWSARLLTILLYGLLVVLIGLQRRPRIVMYNASERDVANALPQVIQQLDPNAELVGTAAVLPRSGTEFSVDFTRGAKATQLVSLSHDADMRSWTALRRTLARTMQQHPVASNPRGYLMILMGLTAFSATAILGATDWPALARGFSQWFYR